LVLSEAEPGSSVKTEGMKKKRPSWFKEVADDIARREKIPTKRKGKFKVKGGYR